jgi:hypothetical protein
MPHTRVLIVLAIVALAIALLVILWPRLKKSFGPQFTKTVGELYQKRFFKQIQKKFPLLGLRLNAFELSPERSEAFQTAMKRLPPQEGMKLQAEFNRLRDNFLVRHPEIAPVLSSGEDGRAQAKALDALMKLPAPQREALDKDLIWAWDQLRGKFPRWMGTLEASFKKKAP